MTPDAKLRMNVYHEGQVAFRTGVECPYDDWRRSTWMKGRETARLYYADLLRGSETTLCGLCGVKTDNLGTKRCDRCWEMETRIKSDPALARQILDNISSTNTD